ncbi:2-phosphosulfolactate phosphatase [Pseudodesulfovibrio sediminis]|uniref:Probable 2-phosphosulfolactate phosphatase n=1 Tax=Pseudodesulfovibrio sediminis TaxID=2810563 RepID=A0ABN6EN66_9BACT|nr:2-phosphosulfolactate phosphatase [Pseudodesulfovibrio sediminis]BCS87616.1 hypothetical protein PSDVSF_08580 [Pseudodesulfovibrio sediminis]
MIVNVVECLAQAERAKGLAVIIDVFRSSTVACYAFDKGVGAYYAVDSLDRAKELASDKSGLVIGEKRGVPVEAFDLKNSPTLLKDVDLTGETLIHSTNAGTKGMALCNADQVLTGSFVNAQATVEYIRQQDPELVTLVAMGAGGTMRAQEDMMCAMYIKNALEEYPNSFDTLKSFLAGVDSAEMFFDDARTDAPENDFEMCMDLDLFDFVIKAESVSEGVVQLNMISVAIGETA